MIKRVDYKKFLGTKPITAYQGIAKRHQPIDEDDQHSAQKRSNDEKHQPRRFVALRKLIDNLKLKHNIQRIDYISAEQEIRVLAKATIDKNLTRLLLNLSLSDYAIKQIITRINDHVPLLKLTHRSSTDQLDRSLYPNVDHSIQVLNLDSLELSLPIFDFSCVELAERCKNKPITTALANLYLTVSYQEKKETHAAPEQSFQISLAIPSGVIEVDTATGRRAFLYQRVDKSFALYADKQIDIEI